MGKVFNEHLTDFAKKTSFIQNNVLSFLADPQGSWVTKGLPPPAPDSLVLNVLRRNMVSSLMYLMVCNKHRLMA